MANLLILQLLFCFTRGQNSNSTSLCLTRFSVERDHFKPCLTQYVIMDPEMGSTENDQALFPCKNRKKFFEVFLSRFTRIAFESLCVWGGKTCTYNEMVKFVSDRAKDPSTAQYQFGVQGMVAQLPHRLNPNIRTTVTLSEGRNVIVKARKGRASGIQTGFETAFRGFESGTWIALGIFAGILLATATLVSYVFTASIWPIGILLTMTTEPIVPEDDQSTLPTYRMHRAVVSLFGLTIFAFFIITILFYEMSIVNFIFNEPEEKLPKPLHDFTDDELSVGTSLSSSTIELVIVRGADPDGTRFKNKNYPWKRCYSADACFKQLLDPNDPVIYMPMYEPGALFSIKVNQACGKLVVLGSDTPLGRGAPFGWYLSTSVDENVFNKVNSELLELTLSGSLKDITDRFLSGDKKYSGTTKLDISPAVIMTPLTLILGPLVIIILGLITRKLASKTHKDEKRTKEEVVSPTENE